MSLTGAYDPANIFAKILRGEIPSAKVWENENILAFMDVFPQSRGHTLVIPKHSTARNLLEEDPAVLAPLILGVQRVTRGGFLVDGRGERQQGFAQNGGDELGLGGVPPVDGGAIAPDLAGHGFECEGVVATFGQHVPCSYCDLATFL